MTDEDIKAIRMLEFIVNHNSLLGYKPENREALAEYIINLIEKQQNKIDRVIKYISEETNWRIKPKLKTFLVEQEIECIYKILKGENNE